ncbi:MAG: hypothetical protein HYT94_02505 [Parcubacteria group bacterium]|nr:hypothetical protein [Parcubacteria group bacterium]
MKNINTKIESGIRNQESGGLRFLRFVFVFLIPYSLFLIPSVSADQNSFALTITPPLFQMTASPGQNWSSAIKVVNNNPYDITVYASVMNFQAQDEGGAGKFIPSNSTSDVPGGYTLASWFEVSKAPIFIRAEQSVSVPFTLHVPESAEPGGHYGAILIGTEPPPKTGGSSVRVASQIASLFLVRVNGDVIEKGDIRSFSSEQSLYQEPHATFNLRFENKGNVHLLPQGDITIYNMWGKERGRISINQESDFGNVLPQSIRKFTFEWAGEPSFFDLGRYKAVATLAFGEKEKKTVYRAAAFWVIPVVPVLKITAFLIIFAWFVVWSIRRYVKKALALEAGRLKELGYVPKEKAEPQKVNREVLARPLVLGAVDLRKAVSQAPIRHEKTEEKMTVTRFAKKYKLFLAFVIVAVFGIIGISRYFDDVLARYRNFDVQVIRENTKDVLTVPVKL